MDTIVEKLIKKQPITDADLSNELYDICDRVHASCDSECSECPVYPIIQEAGITDCPCHKDGDQMLKLLRGEITLTPKTPVEEPVEENKQKNLRQQIEAFKNGEYNDPDKQCEAGWYDWFCKDSSLVNKTKSLYAKVIKISKSSKINLDTMYVFFKNNSPMNGSLYDDFRICDLVTGDVIYTVVPSSGHVSNNGKGEVWGKENNFDAELFKGTWKEIVNWFLAKETK